MKTRLLSFATLAASIAALVVACALPSPASTITSDSGGGGGTTYTGTAHEVIVTGSVLSTPQDIDTVSKPQFLGVGVGGAAGASDTIKLYGSTSGSLLIQAAAVTTQSVTYTLPAGASNAGDFWTTDASGNVLPRTLQAGAGITITRSGTTVTLASTGGGGGGGAGTPGQPFSAVVAKATSYSVQTSDSGTAFYPTANSVIFTLPAAVLTTPPTVFTFFERNNNFEVDAAGGDTINGNGIGSAAYLTFSGNSGFATLVATENGRWTILCGSATPLAYAGGGG